MTLIAVYNSEGVRRCDARCYNAKQPKCSCVCNGANHGKGFTGALEQTRDMVGELLQRASRDNARILLTPQVIEAEPTAPGGAPCGGAK
ncbi:MAG: hypothetical protein QN144_14515 [Armatimonadota bacterium]|nr:hypothetical protein [Armatimonadota bacterium]